MNQSKSNQSTRVLFKTIQLQVKFRHVDQTRLLNHFNPLFCTLFLSIFSHFLAFFFFYKLFIFKLFSCFHGPTMAGSSPLHLLAQLYQQFLYKLQKNSHLAFCSLFAFVQQMCCLPAKLLLNLIVASRYKNCCLTNMPFSECFYR